jgi:Protein of unknown function (DUF1569)
MTFLEPNLNALLEKIEQLNENTKPLWGQMSAQRMIEHLSDTIILSHCNHPYQLTIPIEKIEKAQRFIHSDHPMPKNFKVEFAKTDIPTRNSDLTAAIEELIVKWNDFETFYKANPNHTALHPSFGKMDYNQWLRLHSKHFSHHFEQFGV